MGKVNKPLTEREFSDYLREVYRPSQSEVTLLDPTVDTRFPPDVKYAMISKSRCYKTYRAVVGELSRVGRNLKVLDLGFFPGTLIRELKELLGEQVWCYGAGLKVDPQVEQEVGPYVEDCFYKEFDPYYGDTHEQLKIDDGSMDVVVANEIIEHLISPLVLIKEGARVLREGGKFVITTPNVSHAGAVIKLMAGRSNYERLDRSPMYLRQDEWRGHIRFYDRWELRELFSRHNLELVHHEYYTEHGWEYAKQTAKRRLVQSAKKVFGIIPRYRDGHFAVFSKVVGHPRTSV